MSSYIKRRESVFFQFRNGKSVLNSQCKPRMFKTAEKATLGVNYIDTDEIVEYAEVVRCRNCVNWECFADEPCMGECHNSLKWDGVYKTTYDCDFCSEGERREDDG